MTLLATWQLARANRESMNIEGSFRHLLTDVVAFLLTAVAGVVILATGWTRADGVASLAIAGIMLVAAYGLLRDSGRVLLEAAPEGTSVEEIGAALAAHPHVASVHDLHVWLVSSDLPALSAHVLVHPGDDCHAIRRELEVLLHDRFGITHTTLQVDHADSPPAAVDQWAVGSWALIQATYVGHATVLIELDGARLLTDPVLRDRVLHLRRAPTAVVPSLGELDAVLVSHAHWDHLDLGSLKRLGRDVRIVIPRGAGKLVRRRGFADVVELDLGDRVEIGSVSVTATPCRPRRRPRPVRRPCARASAT